MSASSGEGASPGEARVRGLALLAVALFPERCYYNRSGNLERPAQSSCPLG
jgi:hypothetical protein